MSKPALCLQTVYFHESDQEAARRLGEDLYQHLTRPANDPLSFGAGIPVAVGVAADQVDLAAAEVLVLLPVLGKTSFNLQRDRVLAELHEWHAQLGSGHVLPVPTSENWRAAEGRLPGKQLLTELYEADDPRRKTIDEIVLAAARLMQDHAAAEESVRQAPPARLFVSHAKADLPATGAAAKRIYDYVVTDSTGAAFFDTRDLRPGESLEDQLAEAVTHGVLVVVRGDAYSSRAWCQRELLRAKQQELPTLTVELLRQGEQRSSPYLGNGPSVVWDGNPAPIASRAMVEWLRAVFFRREAERLCRAADLPSDTRVLSRPPELLDLAQGPLQSGFAQLVLYPDPELPALERQVLRAARPRLQLVTPTTAFRRLLSRDDRQASGSASRADEGAQVSSPLEGMQVAMSLSDPPDEYNPAGYTKKHAIDATVYVARTLISAGAAIAYGGDFRTSSYTELLALLIQAYNQTATKAARELHNYLAAHIPPEEAPEGLPLAIHHLHQSPEMAKLAIMPVPAEKRPQPVGFYLSDMRRVMAQCTQARVILGGQVGPRLVEGAEEGYQGRYPGVVEEAWRSLAAAQPLYVLGGFGGAAALVAELLGSGKTPRQLLDRTWMKSEYYAQNAKTFEASPWRKKLGLPRRLEDLAAAISKLARRHMATDRKALAWNGLSRMQNQRLFRSRDPVELASLVLKGLLNVTHQQSSRKLNIELVHGSVTTASRLDAIAIATFDDVPLGGAGAVLDQAAAGRASAERASGRRLIPLESPEIDANWLFLASLGKLEAVANLTDRIAAAARETAAQAHRHGFQRLGVVAFGGTVLPDARPIAEAMLSGFKELQFATTITWFETNADRFEQLRKALSGHESIELTTRVAAAGQAASPARQEALILQVSLECDRLSVTTLPPVGTAVASVRHVPLSPAELAKFAEGGGANKRQTPSFRTLQTRGQSLARMLLGDEAGELLQRCRASKVVVIHDVASSKLPFEMIATPKPDARPAVDAGLSRRLAVTEVSVGQLFAQPPKQGRLKVLLIVNPTEDLVGAEDEGELVKSILEQQKNRIELKVLFRDQATVAAARRALPQCDVLHYCGHAFFDGPGTEESGLLLAGGQRLTSSQLRKISPLPRVALVNACQAGRVRGEEETDTAAFAELFLRSGVEAYLGTYWQVQDRAAKYFAESLYSHLAAGEFLDAAVLRARQALFEAGEADWANYILYGEGNFRLVVGEAQQRS